MIIEKETINMAGTTHEEPLDSDSGEQESCCQMLAKSTLSLSKRISLIFSAIMFKVVLGFIFEPSSEHAESSDAILSLLVPIILTMIATLLIPRNFSNILSEQSLPIMIEIIAHMTGWAFVSFFVLTTLTETLSSAGISLVLSLLLCVFYGVCVQWLRETPFFTASIRYNHEKVTEILRDFDIDVVGYILGYLSYSFGLQIVVNVAEKESGGDHGEDEHDVVNIKRFSTAFVILLLVASALLVLIVESLKKYTSLQSLTHVPTVTLQTCAVMFGFVYSEFIFEIVILQHGNYEEEGNEHAEPSGRYYVYGLLVILSIYLVNTCLVYIKQKEKMKRKAKKKSSESRNSYIKFFKYLRFRINRIRRTAIPIAVGQIFEVILEIAIISSLEDADEWVQGVLFFAIGFISTIISFYVWEPQDTDEDDDSSVDDDREVGAPNFNVEVNNIIHAQCRVT